MYEALGLCPGSVPVVGAACTVVSGAAGKVAGAGVGAVFSVASNWVASGAVWLLGQVGQVLSATTSVDLGAPVVRRPRSGDGHAGCRRGAPHDVLCRHPGRLPPKRVDAAAHLPREPAAVPRVHRGGRQPRAPGARHHRCALCASAVGCGRRHHQSLLRTDRVLCRHRLQPGGAHLRRVRGCAGGGVGRPRVVARARRARRRRHRRRPLPAVGHGRSGVAGGVALVPAPGRHLGGVGVVEAGGGGGAVSGRRRAGRWPRVSRGAAVEGLRPSSPASPCSSSPPCRPLRCCASFRPWRPVPWRTSSRPGIASRARRAPRFAPGATSPSIWRAGRVDPPLAPPTTPTEPPWGLSVAASRPFPWWRGPRWAPRSPSPSAPVVPGPVWPLAPRRPAPELPLGPEPKPGPDLEPQSGLAAAADRRVRTTAGGRPSTPLCRVDLARGNEPAPFSPGAIGGRAGAEPDGGPGPAPSGDDDVRE